MFQNTQQKARIIRGTEEEEKNEKCFNMKNQQQTAGVKLEMKKKRVWYYVPK